ncbi:HAUS augmin-like complex subunit 5 [Clupea harengus]|uniref:HAUS augmin-like complex subunit 5 n=1 Tax=Clupea harengus TaxID=7950 RepID=A0A6P8FVM1_CLUHA|nr:HAUS augmin-like complex subunit 5 [Clupea harengus]
MVDRDLKRWAIKEFNYPSNKLPPDRCLRKICAGQRSSIWKYVTQRVLKEKKVEIRRRNVNWYKRLEDDELTTVEAVRKREIQREIKELKAQIHKQDSTIKEAEEDLQRNEKACSESWSRHEERGRRELLLRSFLQRCGDVRRSLTDHTEPFREQRRALEQHLSKGEVELSFDMSEGGDSLNVEPLVMHEVRKLCEDRVQFLRSVQAEAEDEDEQSKDAAFLDYLTPAQREAVYKDWLNAVKAFLQTHPPRHVLSAFYVLTYQQQRAHQQPPASEGGNAPAKHRSQDEQKKDENRPSLKTLFQAAWAEAERSVVELTQTRSRTQEVRNAIRVLLNEEMMLLDEQDHHKHSALSQRLQRVCKAAERRSIQEQCAQIEAQALQMERDAHSLREQQKGILGLRRTVANRQEKVRELITAISLLQKELIHMHSEIRQFLKANLFPLYGEIIELIGSLSNYVFMETRQFGSVSMAALDCRELNGDQKVPACELSIYRINSPRYVKLCNSLDFPLYKAPAELLSHVALQRVLLRRRRNALLLLSSSTAAVCKAITQLPVPDCKALLEKVQSVDDDLQRTVLPRAAEALSHCNKGLDSCSQAKTATKHWWEQPAQFALPEMCVEGKTLLQWLYRWQRATKKHEV